MNIEKREKYLKNTVMKRTIKIFVIFALAIIASSCTKENQVCYRFEVHNAINMPMTIRLSSWGNYEMYINNIFDSKYEFHEVEIINPHSGLIFSKTVGDDPDPYEIPLGLKPGWKYISAIECDGVSIPKAYFVNQENWERRVASQINGIFTIYSFIISPELIEQFRTNSPT